MRPSLSAKPAAPTDGTPVSTPAPGLYRYEIDGRCTASQIAGAFIDVVLTTLAIRLNERSSDEPHSVPERLSAGESALRRRVARYLGTVNLNITQAALTSSRRPFADRVAA